MNARLLMMSAIISGFSTLVVFVVISEYEYDESPFDDRKYLKEVVYASTDCSRFWRTNLFEMWDDPGYDYKNDPIFIECSEALKQKKESILE